MSSKDDAQSLLTAALDAIWDMLGDAKSYENVTFEQLVTRIRPWLIAPTVVAKNIRDRLGKERNRGSYYYGRDVGPGLRDDRLRELAAIVAQAIAAAPAQAMASGPTRITLRFDGPYGFTPASGLPIAMEQPVAREQGIYVWAVQSPDGYRVNYLGKTCGGVNRCFAERFIEEIEYERGGQGGHFDPDAFARCERLPRQPDSEAQRLREVERILATYRIFMAPISLSNDLMLEVEKRCIRHLKQHSETSRTFLANQNAHPVRLPLQIIIAAPVHLVGFENVQISS